MRVAVLLVVVGILGACQDDPWESCPPPQQPDAATADKVVPLNPPAGVTCVDGWGDTAVAPGAQLSFCESRCGQDHYNCWKDCAKREVYCVERVYCPL